MSTGKQVQEGKVIYFDTLIEMILILSYVYSLPLRQTEGFVNSIHNLYGQSIAVPDYITVCGRRKSLDVR
jgi:hypothetical protein